MLYNEVWPKVKAYVKRNGGDEHGAKDVFHDGILKIIKMIKNESLRRDIEIIGYLFVTCKNFWIEKARRDSKIQLTDKNLDFKSSVESSFSDLLRSEKSSEFEKVLKIIGDKCRELLKLTFYEDRPLLEVAEIMGFASANVAKTTQYRCKKKLLDEINSSSVFKELLK